ncbi:MAG: hypothetical protein M3224_03370, partial [Thermoproteota archaeon]|nr:hypothetical protein [Thermoproteota archaeon]
KKEARGKTDKDDLGKVQKVWDNHILTVKGILKKTYFYISKELVECFDGQILRFKVTEKEKDAKEVIINMSPTVEECQSSSSSTNSPLSQSSKNGQTDDHVIKDLEDSNAMVEKQSQIKETIAEKEIADVSLVFREIPFRALPYKHIVKPLPFRIMPILTLTLMPLPLPNIIAREVEKSLITNTKVTIPLKHEETVAPLIIENPSLIEEIIEKRESMAETKRIKDEILREIINIKI